MLPGAATRLNEDHVLMMAGVVESYSVHILSKGIAKAGAEALARLRQRFEDGQRLCPEPEASWPGHGREYPVIKNINEDAGKGVSGEVNGHAGARWPLSSRPPGRKDSWRSIGPPPVGLRMTCAHDLGCFSRTKWRRMCLLMVS